MPLFKKPSKERAAPTETTGGPTTATSNLQPAPQVNSRTGKHEPISHSGNRPLTEDYPGYDREVDYLPPGITGTGYGTKNASGASGTHGYESCGMNEPSYGIGPATTGMQQTTLPPTGTLNNQDQKRGSTGQKIKGKMESAVGSTVGSENLKAKGIQKEREANAIKLQGRELAEAERLEQEAMMRRERAVAHGAHPMNQTPGAGLGDHTREQYP